MILKKLFRQTILAAVFMSGWLLTPCGASDSFHEKNDQKIKLINQAIRTALQEKKIEIHAEDVYRHVPRNIFPGKESQYSDDSLEDAEDRLRQKFLKEARVRYPVYVMGDTITVFGQTETISGKYNKKNKLGIWVGTKMIPWSDLSPECAAQFTYEKVVKLRSDYVQNKIIQFKHKNLIKVNGKWVSSRQYIKTQMMVFQKILAGKNLQDIKKYNWISAVACFLFAGMIFYRGGSGKKGILYSFFKSLVAAIICCLIGYFTSEYFCKRILKQKIDQTVDEMLKSIVDPDVKSDFGIGTNSNQPRNYRFYRIEENHIDR